MEIAALCYRAAALLTRGNKPGMHTDPFLLTIAIPTYNRSRYLARLLDSLLPQLEGRSEVELLISDNASPDDTPSVLQGYRARGLRFRCIRNQTNIGPDRNFVQCFTEAAGKYVWIIGDDDILLGGSLALVLGLLKTSDYDIVHLRGRDIIEGEPLPLDCGPPEIESIDDARTFVLRTHIYMTFITGNIVNKQRVDLLAHPPFLDLAGTFLVQLGWVYTSVRYFRTGAYIHNRLIAVGAEDRGGYALYEVFGTTLARITRTWLVEPALVRIVLNATVQFFFPTFVLNSRISADTLGGVIPEALLASLFAGNYRYYLFLYPLLKLPVKLGRGWLVLVKIINRLDKAAGNPMLR
jgi:glycosyltransferase involved in cell wall biosynthesis